MNRRRERGNRFLDRGAEAVNRFVDIIQMGKDLADQNAMDGPKPPGERLLQRRQLLAELTTREIRKHLWIMNPSQQRIEHRPGRLPLDVGNHAAELDAGVLQRLL